MMNDTNSPQQNQISTNEYEYNYTYIEPLAMVDTLPLSENFSDAWKKLAARQALKLAINTLLVNLGNQSNRSSIGIEDDVREFLRQILLQTLQENGKSFKPRLARALITLLPQVLLPDAQSSTKDVLSPVAEVELSKRIETAIEQLLQPPSTAAENTALKGIDLASPPPSQDEPATAAEVIVSRKIDTALQQALQGIPSNESEVDKFVASSLLKVLGEDFLRTFAKNLYKGLKQRAPKGRASSLEDYRKLFRYIKLPEVADTFQNDEFFAYMRVAGPNPAMIVRMTAPDQRFPVTEEQYKSVMGSDLHSAIAEGRVYLADYAILDGAVNGTFGAEPQLQKYAYAPLAMFAVPAQDAPNRLLRPVAIQCGSAADYPVITPSTGADAWLMAKTIVQIADANFHEAVTHLARTHLLIEPFVIATHRQLPTEHSLFKLLKPHFQGTLAINYAAHEFLVAPKGGVNDLLSSPIENSRVLAVKGLQARGFNADMLPRRLQDRGVEDPSKLPVYPYRDDGLLIWGAIHDWVEAYLSLYYNSDNDVQGDLSLQNWAQELVAFDGGRLQDFGDRDGKIATLEYLVDAVTMVIFTSSAQHAAVNFPQNGIMSFAPAMPTAGYETAKGVGVGTSKQDWLNLLPPLDQAQQQINLLYLLGSVYFTKLGNYEDGYFSDSKVVEPLQMFQKSLQEIEEIINLRNLERPAYDHLKPTNIPQSINI